MAETSNIFTKDNANWLAPLIAFGVALLAFAGLGEGITLTGLLGAAGVAGVAAIASQAVTNTVLFAPGGIFSKIKSPTLSQPVADTRPERERGKAGPRFDQLLEELLEKNEGVFLGEHHSKHAMMESLTALLPTLKAKGVQTISIETHQRLVDRMWHAKSVEEVMHNTFSDPAHVKRNYELIQAAKKLNMQVLGHDSISIKEFAPHLVETMEKSSKNELSPQEEEILSDRIYEARASDKVMRLRDNWSLQYINAHKLGKVIVIGGAEHSGQYSSSNHPLEHLNGDYKGLDVLLNYPSVDFASANAKYPPGTTVQTDGKYNNYIVNLPNELKDLRNVDIASWPAMSGNVIPPAPPQNGKSTPRSR